MTDRKNYRRINPIAKALKEDSFKLKIITPKTTYKRLRPKDIIKELIDDERDQNDHHVIR